MLPREGAPVPNRDELTLVPKGDFDKGNVIGSKVGTHSDAVKKLGIGVETVVVNEAGQVVYKKPVLGKESNQKAA